MRNLFRQRMHRAFNIPNHFRQRMHRAFNMPNHFRQLMHRAFNMLRKFWPRCLALKACLIAPRKPRLRWIMTAVATWLSPPSLAHGSPIRGGLTMRARRTSRAVWTFTKSPATTRANYLLIPPSRYPLCALPNSKLRAPWAFAPLCNSRRLTRHWSKARMAARNLRLASSPWCWRKIRCCPIQILFPAKIYPTSFCDISLTTNHKSPSA